jgi:hypothetical protein
MVKDIPTVKELLDRMMAEAEEALSKIRSGRHERIPA